MGDSNSKVESKLGDVVFPDNPEREHRLHQLVGDIQNFAVDLANDAREIKANLSKLDAKVRVLYGKVEVPIPSSATKKVNYGGVVFGVSELLEPLLVYPAAFVALKRAATCFLLGEGKIGPAALVELVGLPPWISIAVGVGAIVVTIGMEFANAAIAGEEKRKILRKRIHEAEAPRVQLKKAAIINGMLKRKLAEIHEEYETMMSKTTGYTKEELDMLQGKVCQKFKAEVDITTDETAREQLATMDKSRGSWTKED